MVAKSLYGKRAFFSRALFFVFCLGVCSHLQAGAVEPQKVNAQSVDASQEPFAYVIGPQNVLQIKIFGDASANQIYRVDERGTINHALLGPIRIGGLSVAEAEKLIQNALADGYFVDPRVTIFVLEHSHFSVLGEVKKTGTYEILGRTSVIEAISMAGGFSPVADQRGVKIIRRSGGKESTIDVDTTRITGRGESSADINIEADDVIVVSKSFF